MGSIFLLHYDVEGYPQVYALATVNSGYRSYDVLQPAWLRALVQIRRADSKLILEAFCEIARGCKAYLIGYFRYRLVFLLHTSSQCLDVEEYIHAIVIDVLKVLLRCDLYHH